MGESRLVTMFKAVDEMADPTYKTVAVCKLTWVVM